MFNTIDEFLAEWANECQSTMKLLNCLTDESLNVKVYPEGRTLGFIAWHITNTIGEMMSKAGLDVNAAENHDEEPATAKQILDEYQKQSQAMVKSLNEKWTNDTLNLDFDMYGQTWKGGQILWGLVKHEIHHRGQLSVYMRFAGLRVPGIYGPAREEWESYGMPAMK